MAQAADRIPTSHLASQASLEDTYWWHQNRMQLAATLLAPHCAPGCRILDLGCGTGGFLASLRDRLKASRAVGVDASPSAVEFCRAKGLEVIAADLMHPLTIEENAFDVATAMDVLEHLPGERPLLESALRNLKPGGVFLAAVPAYACLTSGWDRTLRHYRRYTLPALRDVFAGLPFKTLRGTYAFSYALAPAAVKRLLDRPDNSTECVFPKVPRALNGVLRGMGALETLLLSGMNLPFGLSVYILARKE